MAFLQKRLRSLSRSRADAGGRSGLTVKAPSCRLIYDKE
jgi:hypothetical protein